MYFFIPVIVLWSINKGVPKKWPISFSRIVENFLENTNFPVSGKKCAKNGKFSIIFPQVSQYEIFKREAN